MNLNSDHIILSTLFFIASSDQITDSEKHIIDSFIKSGSFLRKQRLNSFVKRKMSSLDFDLVVNQARNMDGAQTKSLIDNIVKIICADGIISDHEAAVTTILCAKLGIDHQQIFGAIESHGLNIASYNNFIKNNIQEQDRNEVGFLAAKARNNQEIKSTGDDNVKTGGIFCKYCGSSGTPKNAAFCKSCGKQIN